MLLSPAPSKKAGALAVSLATQTLAIGTLMLIPLLYTDRLPFVQFQLPTFMPPSPPPPPRNPEPTPRHRTAPRVWNPYTSPTTIPPLNTRPDTIDDAPAPLNQIDSGLPMLAPPSTIFTHVIAPPPQAPPVAEPAASKPITVTSEIQSAKLIRKVVPVYPRLAISGRISGTVRLIGTVGKDGNVQQIQVVSGPPLLVQAALDAVRQWIYSPTILNNKPMEVIAPISVTFTLSQ